MRTRVACAAVAGAAVLSIASGAASAQTEAYTSTPVYLYAGPGQEYPVVAELPAGLLVTVYGCVSGYAWCDVAIPQARGWVYGGDLAFPYQGSYVPMMAYGTVIGVPLITFSPGTYWGYHYRDRPWYYDRWRWEHHHPPPSQPPPNHPPPPQGANRPPPPPPPEQGPQPLGADHGHRARLTQPPPSQGGGPGPGQPPAQGGRPPGPPPGHIGGPPPGQPPAQIARPVGPAPAPGMAHPSGPPPGQGRISAPQPPPPLQGRADHGNIH